MSPQKRLRAGAGATWPRGPGPGPRCGLCGPCRGVLSAPAACRTMAHAERTFIAVKPDGVQRGLVGEIIKRFEQKGFRLVALKFLQVHAPLPCPCGLRVAGGTSYPSGDAGLFSQSETPPRMISPLREPLCPGSPPQGASAPLTLPRSPGGKDALGRLSGGNVTRAPGLLPPRGCVGPWAAGGQQGVEKA